MINQLLNDHKINEDEVFKLLSSMSENGSDYSDLFFQYSIACLLYTSPSPRDLSTSRMPSSA